MVHSVSSHLFITFAKSYKLSTSGMLKNVYAVICLSLMMSPCTLLMSSLEFKRELFFVLTSSLSILSSLMKLITTLAFHFISIFLFLRASAAINSICRRVVSACNTFLMHFCGGTLTSPLERSPDSCLLPSDAHRKSQSAS